MFTKGLWKVIIHCVLIGTITTVGEFIFYVLRKLMDGIDIEED